MRDIISNLEFQLWKVWKQCQIITQFIRTSFRTFPCTHLADRSTHSIISSISTLTEQLTLASVGFALSSRGVLGKTHTGPQSVPQIPTVQYLPPLKRTIVRRSKTTNGTIFSIKKIVALAHLGERQTEALSASCKLRFHRTISGGTVFDPQKRHFLLRERSAE